MVMMISKFNKLLGSKLVWIIFILLVIFAFVFSFTPGSSGMLEAARDTSVATLNGETIDYATLRINQSYEELSLAMRNQNAAGADLEQNAYQRIALLTKAEALGIKTTDADLNQAIKQSPLFQKDGKFDPNIYQNIVVAINQNFSLSAGQFETFLRQELVLQKVRNLMYNSSLIAPGEIREIYKNINDLFTVEYVNLTPGLIQDLEITDEQLLAFYEENKESYYTPAEARVQYIEIPYNSFEDTVELSEDDLYAYYEANPAEFTRTVTNTVDTVATTNVIDSVENTNGVELAAATNNIDDILNVVDDSAITTTNLSFEEVRETIVPKLKSIKSKSIAIDKAEVISIDVAQENPDFSAVCQTNKVEVKETPMFAQGGIIENIDPVINLSQVAFELNISSQYERVTDTLEGTNAVYVAYLTEAVAPRIKTFEEMETIISIQAEQYYIRQELASKADEIRTSLVKSAKETGTFKEAAASQNLEIESTIPFSHAGNELADSPIASFIYSAVGNLPKGTISEVISHPGGQIILYIAERKPSDMADYDTTKIEIENSLNAGKANLLMEEFQKYIMEQGDFTPVSSNDNSDEES